MEKIILVLCVVYLQYCHGLERRQRDNTYVGCFDGVTCHIHVLRFNCSSDEVISVQEYAAAYSITWDNTGTECLLPSDPNCFSVIKGGYNITALCDNKQSCQLDACLIYENVEGVICDGTGFRDPNAVTVNYTCHTSAEILSSPDATPNPESTEPSSSSYKEDAIITKQPEGDRVTKVLAATVSVIACLTIVIIVLAVLFIREKRIGAKTKLPTNINQNTIRNASANLNSSFNLDNEGFQNMGELQMVPNGIDHQANSGQNPEYVNSTGYEIPEIYQTDTSSDPRHTYENQASQVSDDDGTQHDEDGPHDGSHDDGPQHDDKSYVNMQSQYEEHNDSAIIGSLSPEYEKIVETSCHPRKEPYEELVFQK